MPLLARHEGVWRGRYRHVTPAFETIDEHDFRIVVELPRDDSCSYRQTSHYRWLDGRTEDRVFEADYSPGENCLTWDNGRIAGRLLELDDTTLYLTFSFSGEPSATVCEMIQLSPCSQHRARTWHWFRDGRLTQLTLVDEWREA